MKNALLHFSRKATEQPDYLIRCQSDFADAVPELTAEIKQKFLVSRTAKTDFAPFCARFGIELPDDIKAYINLYWHASVYGVYDCCKQNEAGDGSYQFDEGLVLFPVIRRIGETDDDVLFHENGVYRLTEELYEDYADSVKDVGDYICIGWTEHSAYKILYQVSTGEIYLESSTEGSVTDEKPIAASLPELINRLYFLHGTDLK